MSWQTMESAPKNMPILVTDGFTITTVEWHEHQYSAWWSLIECGSNATDSYYEPTHWMPLPNKPE